MKDPIERQEAIDIVTGYSEQLNGYIGTPNDTDVYAYARGLILGIERNLNALQSAQNVPIEDLISRNAAIEAMSESLKRVFPEHRQIAEKCLKALPSAQPERKKGKWIPLFDGRPTCGVCWFYCSKCEKVVRNIEWNFCPNCGADMMEGQ